MKVGRMKGLFYISVYLGISPPLEPFDPDMPLLWALGSQNPNKYGLLAPNSRMVVYYSAVRTTYTFLRFPYYNYSIRYPPKPYSNY